MKYISGVLILFYSLNTSAQQAHIIAGYDHYFSPDTADVNIGDTVRLESFGYHSILNQNRIIPANKVTVN